MPACVDKANGGYLESLKGGQFAPTGEKFVTLQARQLWFFSTLASAGIEKEAAGASDLEELLRPPVREQPAEPSRRLEAPLARAGEILLRNTVVVVVVEVGARGREAPDETAAAATHDGCGPGLRRARLRRTAHRARGA